MWEDFARAVCLFLVIEGILPFLYPTRWRQMLARVVTLPDQQLRMMGLFSMLLGAGLLYLLK
jgi:uncharacterized protein YjeT (DUF2065 family)